MVQEQPESKPIRIRVEWFDPFVILGKESMAVRLMEGLRVGHVDHSKDRKNNKVKQKLRTPMVVGRNVGCHADPSSRINLCRNIEIACIQLIVRIQEGHFKMESGVQYQPRSRVLSVPEY